MGDHSSSSLHSLRGGSGLGDANLMNSPALMTSVSSKPALPPKPQTATRGQIANNKFSVECDISRSRHVHHTSGNSVGTIDRRQNQQQYYQKEREHHHNSPNSHTYHHQRSYSAGRRSAHSHSRSGSRTPRGSSSRTSRESLGRVSRESLSNSRERGSNGGNRIRKSNSEPLEDADGDEESEGNNTSNIGLKSGSRPVRNSNSGSHSEHRIRITHNHQHGFSHNSRGGGSVSSHDYSSKEGGSIEGVRNRKSSSVD